jgi:prepilin-type N-terminal cleavage/methylation domain-containing protein
MMSHSSSPGLRSDRGFTLVELLIGMAIGTILIGAVGAALVIGLRITEEAGQQVSEAAWAQIVGSWFLTDVHSAEQVGVEPTCDFPGSLVESFAWTADPDVNPPAMQHVAWWLDDDGVLRRTECDTTLATIREVVVAKETAEDGAVIEFEDDGTVRVTWTAMATETAAGRSDADRTYKLTAVRRTG